MKKLVRFFNFDRTASLIWVCITILIFIAQGPYDRYWKNYLPFIPLLIVFIVLAIKQTIITIYSNKFKYFYEEYKIVTMTRITATWFGRIENEHGDFHVKKQYKMKLIQPGTIHKTKGEVMFVQNELNDLPPQLIDLKSNNIDRRIEPTEITKVPENIKGDKCFKYEWRYIIKPPLTKIDDFIDYSYEYNMLGVLEKAFTAEGDTFVFEQRKIQQETNVTIVAPKGYIFVIKESFIEDYDGNKRDIPKIDNKPELVANGSIFKWQIEYIHLSRNVCVFNLIKG